MCIYYSQTIPYTYLLGWTHLNIYYYGLRYARECHPDDLWNTYFTSSKYVTKFASEHGDPDIKQIRKVFNNVDSARLWEHRVLRRLKVIHRDDFLNKTDNISIAPLYGKDNPATRRETRDAISIGVKKWYETNENPNKETKWTDSEKQEWSNLRQGENNPFYGHSHTNENLIFYSERQQGSNNSFFNKVHSDLQKQKWSEIRSGIPKNKVCCVHCKKEVGINIFPRWHGINCKSINNTV
jgi:hypothetical protein